MSESEIGEGVVEKKATRKRRIAKVKAVAVKKHRGWPKGKKRGPRVKKQRYWSRRPKVQQVTPNEYNTAPSGAKQVGVEVLKTDGTRVHAPLGSTWRWNHVGATAEFNTYSVVSSTSGLLMLEVLDPQGKMLAQIPSQYVSQVAANIWTKPLWS